jgi:NAD(P) transhydrogenase subunit alpha
MIGTMKAGSLIIDLAASTGGNTELTRDNATILSGQVTVIGNSNLAATVPADASKLYGKNVSNFIKLLVNAKGAVEINLKDEIIKGACVATGGGLGTGGGVTTGGSVITPVTLKAV